MPKFSIIIPVYNVEKYINKCLESVFNQTEDDYEVQITSRITGTTSNAIYSEAYKTLKKDGNIISTETISKDTYKRH